MTVPSFNLSKEIKMKTKILIIIFFSIFFKIFAQTSILQAEKGILNNAFIQNTYTGYTGTGYVYLVSKAGSFVEITFRRETASTDTIAVYYSNGSGSNRTLSVTLNGGTATNLSFPKTTNWNTWTSTKMAISFVAGVNRVRFTTTGTSTYPVLDRIEVYGQTSIPVYKLTLTKSGNGIVSASPLQDYYDDSTNVTLTAMPSGNNIFNRWFTENGYNLSNPYIVNMNEHKTIVGILLDTTGMGNFNYESSPVGFASVNALGQNGTTGGNGGQVAIATTTAGLNILLQNRIDPNHTRNLPPITIYVAGILPYDSNVGEMMDIKDAYDISVIGVGNDAIITGFGFSIVRSKNIIVRNIQFASCPDDGVSVQADDDETKGHHIWIDHCTFTDTPPPGYPPGSTPDGALDITHASAYVTVSWCKFTNHDKTCLLGHSDSQTSDTLLKVTYHHNYFDSTVQRHPRVRYGKAHLFNNYYRKNSLYGASSNLEADVVVEGCYFVNVPIPTETSRDGSPPGDLIERNNIYINCGVPGTRGTAFEPALFYSYTIDSATDIPAKLLSYSGSGKYDFSAGSYIPVDVELISFIASSTSEGVLLNWTTASEKNNQGFLIERKSVDEKNYINLQRNFVSGFGTTNTPHHYSFVDRKVRKGNYYYRIKQMDYDGSIKYYGPVNVEVNENVLSENKLYQNYPNPFNPSTTITFYLSFESIVSVKLFNIIGKEVASLIDNQKMNEGKHSINFDASKYSLASGTYILQLKTYNYSTQQKLILIK